MVGGLLIAIITVIFLVSIYIEKDSPKPALIFIGAMYVVFLLIMVWLVYTGKIGHSNKEISYAKIQIVI